MSKFGVFYENKGGNMIFTLLFGYIPIKMHFGHLKLFS